MLNSFGSLKATGSFWSDEWRGGFESSGVTLCKGWGEIRPKGTGLDTQQETRHTRRTERTRMPGVETRYKPTLEPVSLRPHITSQINSAGV